MPRKTSLAAGALALAVVLIGAVTTTLASPASGSTPTLLARGTYPEFKVM